MIWLPALLLISAFDVAPDQAERVAANEAVTPPHAIPGSFMSDLDYPKEAMRLKQQGLSVVQVHVTPAGRVDNCIVQQSSGSQSLDDMACSIARSRRFKPALDAKGKPVGGNAPVRMTWRLPN